jgi:anti-sigma factor RsiW
MKECLDQGTLQGYFDGELSRVNAAHAASHLAACLNCAAAARELESEMSLLATALQPELEVGVPTETLRGRIDEAIAGLQSERNAPTESGSVPDRSNFSWLRAFGFRQPVFSYAAVTVIMIAAVVLGVLYLKRGAVTSGVELARNEPPVHTASPRSSSYAPKSSTGGAPVPVPMPVQSDAGNGPGKTASRHGARASERSATLLPGEQSYIKTIAALDASIKSKGRPMQAGLQVEYEHNLAVVNQAIAVTRAAAQKNPKDPDAAQFVISAYQSKVDLMTQVADARLFDTQRK